MRRQFAALLAATVFGIGSASAADPQFESAFDWTGGYIGASVGLALAEFNYSNCCIGPDGWTAGPLLTVQLGHNWQNDDVVYGIEADISGHWLVAEGKGGFVGDYEEFGSASIRARAGRVRGSDLYYATAGVAFTHVQTSNGSNSKDEDIVAGFTGGVGIETTDVPLFLNLDESWTAKAEVLYVNVPQTRLNSGPPTVGSSHNFLIKLGLNHHF